MDQAVRNRLRNVVTQCRRLLEDATAQALQGRFGIYAAGRKDEVHVEDDARMGHLTDEDRALRRDLLDHLEHIKAVGLKPRDALEQLVREIAFTHLNRLCAYKMMEARGLIREAVSRGLKSQGFFFYLAEHPEDEKLHKTGQQDAAYRNFLDWLGGTLSEEIGVLFNPNDPANRIYPPQRVLDEVLALINDGELKDIWSQDETIGWVYQYFTPKELRDKARKESQAPRNSYELAFRNQFYTPRYVVEFLTDNTLGRTWYEMRKGQTALKDRCRYLVRRPTEVFLAEGQEPPEEAKQARDDLSQEELLKQPVYIPHRPKKDPREIRVLDPACGSGHFLLYCFDLLQIIYEEAYDDPDLGAALRKDYPALADLRLAVPGLILKYNLHGIDIDLRATQIAALALWLRCQRAYQELGLKNSERPRITRSNIVCAEPMPGETDLLKEFTAALQPRFLGQLVETIFEKMKLAGEAGSLLKVEEEIRQAARSAKDEFIAWKKHQEKARGHLFPDAVKRDQPNLLDFADLTDEAFLDRVEEEIVEALRRYATQAENGRGFRRRLFADDAGQGFAFIDLCRERYDVLLMNPPFGSPSVGCRDYLQRFFTECWEDIDAAFVDRGADLLAPKGSLGVIANRTQFFKGGLAAWRRRILLGPTAIGAATDLGYNVLDGALVEAAAYSLHKACAPTTAAFFSALSSENKEQELLIGVGALPESTRPRQNCYVRPHSVFDRVPEARIAYDIDRVLLRAFSKFTQFEGNIGTARQGIATGDNFRFLRLCWEVDPSMIKPVGSRARWAFYSKGGEYSPYYGDIHLLLDWDNDGYAIRSFVGPNGRLASRPQNLDYQGRPGITYSWRTTSGFSPRVMQQNVMFDVVGPAIFVNDSQATLPYLGFLMSRVAGMLVEHLVAAGDISVSGSAAKQYTQGIIGSIPTAPFRMEDQGRMDRAVHKIWRSRCAEDMWEETSRFFVAPLVIGNAERGGLMNAAAEHVTRHEDAVLSILENTLAIEQVVRDAYGVDRGSEQVIDAAFGRHPLLLPQDTIEENAFRAAYQRTMDDLVDDAVEEHGGSRELTKKVYFADRFLELLSHTFRVNTRGVVQCRRRLNLVTSHILHEIAARITSYCVGDIFGRWDIRFATGERQPPPLPDPFDPLPVCPPGMLQGPDGLPAKPEDVPPDYPIRIDWDGILVDDPEHPDDIVRRVRDVLEVLWKDRAEAIEREACGILGVRELRDYFRKPTPGGFWMDHVRRYSKSRRKAPIYWYLRSAKGSYGLWLYYHRLDKDILFKALLNYVEPKIRLEEDRLSTLRARREAAGKSGREAKQVEKDIDRQEQFVAELHDFRDRLRRAADLRIPPDQNDGVVLNIAPLCELVPWKEAKKYWGNLQEGKYDWAHIAYQLWPERVKELCKRDRSVAIAHGLEDLCEVPPPKARRAAASDEALDEDQQEAEEEDADDEAE